MSTIPKNIHFMGIAGSGMSAVAEIAKAQGFSITGCDMSIPPGHNESHLDNCDLLVVTPAVFYQSSNHPELLKAKEQNKVITWQEFMGKYLHPNHTLITVAGTHGKSTTTTLVGLMLEQARLDPTVEVGATNEIWHSNYRLGKGQYFVSEADEYHHNFLNYRPQVIILNNIELDHPEYFGNLDKVLAAFQDFINLLPSDGLLIYNSDSENIHKLYLPTKKIGYSLSKVTNIFQTETHTNFTYGNNSYLLKIAGLHNISNSLGVIELGKHLDIPPHIISKCLSTFPGIARRTQLLGTAKGVAVIDDYANHPTAFKATLSAVRQKYPKSRIWTLLEPHTYSRLRAVLSELPSSLTESYRVIVSPIYASRESNPGDFSSQDIVEYLDTHLPKDKNILAHHVDNFDTICKILSQETKPTDVVLVMGSGNSSKLAHQVFTTLLQ